MKGDYVFSTLEIDDDNYNRLDSVGYPEFQYRQLELIIPDWVNKTQVEVSNVRTRQVNLHKPYMPSMHISPSENIYSLELGEFYSSNSTLNTNTNIILNPDLSKQMYCKWYNISEPYGFVGSKGISFCIYPMNQTIYNPINEILVRATFTIRMEKTRTSSGNPRINMSLKEMIRQYLEGKHYQGIMDYYDSFRGLYWERKEADKGNYAILTLPKYFESLKEFIAYKKSIGYNVHFYDITEYANDAWRLRDIIRALYKWNEYRPRFILIVGNPNEITYSAGTPQSTDDPPTDLYYSCVEFPTIAEERRRNLNPDIYVGRWNVSNEEEVKNITKKTIKTENALYYTNNTNREVIMFSGNEKYFWGDIERINKQINKVWLPTVTYDGRNAKPEDMINELNTVIDDKTPFMLIYSGHGNYNIIGKPYNLTYYDFTDTTIRNSHFKYQPFVFAMACLTNDYSEIDNMGRGFTSISMEGGVTFFGSTVNSYINPDRASFIQIFKKLRTKANYHIADLTAWGMGSYYSGVKTRTRRRQVEKYNLIGDPSLRIYGVALKDGNVGSYAPKPYMDTTSLQEPQYVYKESDEAFIEVSPTIAKDIITISATSGTKIQSILIKDIMGRDIKYFDTDIHNINVSDLHNGVYILTIRYNNRIYTEKIIINR
ncbi:MAG: C25 family cysteine peptidase [Porphyromonadaceae bacterium]|nr:C25 family cysteine peptidase [Porphyromonadaceae bacterium]